MRKVVLKLSPDERDELERLASQTDDDDVRRRATALLHLADAQGFRGAAERTLVNESAVRKWHAAYQADGIDGLATKPRSGRPRKITARDEAHVLAALRRTPAEVGLPGTTWTARLMNEYLQGRSDTRVSDWTIWSYMRDSQNDTDDPAGDPILRATRVPQSTDDSPRHSTYRQQLQEDSMPTILTGEPMRDLMTLRQAMDRLFEETWGQGRQGSRDQSGTLYLPVDVYTTESEVVIMASMPGLSADDVDIVLQGDTVTIRGESKPPSGTVQWALQERPYGKFSRSLTLNIPVNMEKAEAVFENGVLSLSLPKADAAKPRQIQIKAK